MIVYREVSTLSCDLGIPAQTLYAISNHIEKHYHTVQIPKRDASFRRLCVPDEALKKIQRSITNHLLIYMPVSHYAMAYRFGGSIFRNAAPHIKQQSILKLDILHFYDSILYSTVKNAVFPLVIFSEPLRVLLTMLCYHREALPQGAPSSPAISNIIMRQFDLAVGAWCDARGIAYTRYCDDMTFSGTFDEKELLSFVRLELRANGFFLNEHKTKLMHAGQCQSVTGLIVNEKLSIPASYRRKLRQELYYSRKFGMDAHLRTIGSSDCAEQYLTRLLGQVNYVLQASPDNQELLLARRWLMEQLRAR